MKLFQWLRDWTLIIAILTGIVGYFAGVALPVSDSIKRNILSAVELVQPVLIFFMLFLTFVRINPHDIRPCRWHVWLLAVQGGLFALLGLVLVLLPHSGLRIVLEGAMICLICPTATAAAVITRKLGGDMAHITTYTILINLLAAMLIPALIPWVHPNPSLDVWNSAMLILGKVFPLLLMPLVLAQLVRKLMPGLRDRIMRYPDLSFYMWAVALTLAIGVTSRSIVHSNIGVSTQMWLVAVSLLSCVFQFWLGRKIGAHYHDMVTAGQALGQKNTVFAIWLGYTFFSPITAIAGGFYSIWHNVFNSYQLYRHEHRRNNEAVSPQK